MFLSHAEADAIEARIARIEAHTGAQIVAAVVAKCDGYPEAVWKAFALGATLTALIVAVLDAMRPDWMAPYAALAHVLPIIGVGAASALAAVALPAYARVFVDRFRADAEVRQYAQAMFLTRVSRTRTRNGVLVLASLFERKVEIQADIGFDGRVESNEWRSVIDAMTPLLATAQPAAALARGLDRLEELLVSRRIERAGDASDELTGWPIEEGGA